MTRLVVVFLCIFFKASLAIELRLDRRHNGTAKRGAIGKVHLKADGRIASKEGSTDTANLRVHDEDFPAFAFLEKQRQEDSDQENLDFLDMKTMRQVEKELAADASFMESFKDRLVQIIFGVLFIAIAIPIQWFNEERSVWTNTLLVKGESECVSVDSLNPCESNRGRLVHVQGSTRGAVPLVDNQFQDAVVKNCLKLQSTVEVFEWVQTTRTWLDGKERRSQPRFHTEWTTIHHDSLRFKKPSPENPRLPSGLALGTHTKTCSRVQLGNFMLTEDMVKNFHKFVPAMEHLEDKITAHGYVFFANRPDGYYYMRPGVTRLASGIDLFNEHQVGDVRTRFMCVPEGSATVVAVQCEKDFCESFVPYRPIARTPCITEFQERQKRIEEGDRPLKDLKREIACCTGGVASCCCCACNVIACCCKEEVVTEEIFYVSDHLDPMEKAFRWIVPRNPCRVWNFRLLGWGAMFLGVGMILGPFAGLVSSFPSLKAYGSFASLMLSAMITFSTFALILAIAYTFYRPCMALRWYCAIAVILAVPLVAGKIAA